MGKLVYEDCRVSLKRQMRLLEVFEEAGKQAEIRDVFLGWIVPVTNFPVVQHYVEGTIKKIYVPYGPQRGKLNTSGYDVNTLQLSVCFRELPQSSKRKQAQGASPNAIHSLDAAHLTMIVSRARFPVTTIHDSFGCLLCDMPELFTLVRQTLVELYSHSPLEAIMEDIDGDISAVETGELDITLVEDSDYCFS